MAGFPSDICSTSPLADPGVYAITDPAVAGDWEGREVRSRYVGGVHDGTVAARPEGLPTASTALGLDHEGVARAYPLPVLWIHEVVNDGLGGRPVLVTYCALCRSGMVARRRAAGARTTFRATGLLWTAPEIRAAAAERADRVVGVDASRGTEGPLRHAGNVVLQDDATGSYWSQILAQGICGPREGAVLEQIPVTITTWEAWQRSHALTDVLLRPPYSGTTRPE